MVRDKGTSNDQLRMHSIFNDNFIVCINFVQIPDGTDHSIYGYVRTGKPQSKSAKINIYVNYKYLQPLLHDDITAKFLVRSTLIHKMGHVVYGLGGRMRFTILICDLHYMGVVRKRL